MTSDELAARCMHHAHRAMETADLTDHQRGKVLIAIRDGILADGRGQYETVNPDGTATQAFETKTPAALVQDMVEEARDLCNYSVMLLVRLQALHANAEASEP